MDKKLLRCIKCNEITSITEYDSCTEFEYDEEKEDFFERQRDDKQSFYSRHNGHKIEELTIKNDSYISEDTYWEPVKISYFEATNGKENFVVKRWRKDIEEPVNYELIRGSLEIKNSKIEMQTEDLRRQMKAEVPSLKEKKINQFIQIVEKVVSRIDHVKTTKVAMESSHPSIFYSCLDDDSLNNIFHLCNKIFNEKELKRIKEFIHQNNNYNDVITLRVRRNFQVETHKDL
ncbi:MAG: hypothetical protein SV062_09085 [Thermodesulfobacteriota bacterium]|nr:hypothetical protein [Thermodesulfobacteriota bacterium]